MLFFKKNIEYIIIGLGNPGKKYENTRHNAGFFFLNYIAEQENLNFNKKKFDSVIAEGFINNKRVLLIKPETFMNLSGEAVIKFMNFYKIAPEKIIIIFDDINFDVGTFRVRTKGSSGGHNGMKSIISLSGSENFPRIKIGIGKKPDFFNLSDWVLSKFTQEELNILNLNNINIYSALKSIII